MARRGKLTDEDRELWSRVARTATPLHPRRPAQDPAPQDEPPKPRPRLPLHHDVTPPPSPRRFRLGEKAHGGHGHGHDLAPDVATALAAHPLRMDHKTHKRLSRGKLRPEARIDLHGMTLAIAHPELMRFILQSAAAGRRLVLVITGKGKPNDDGGPIPIRQGVLRHQVPAWLHQPPLAPHVLQVVPAHQKHGGGGAYYVYLRR